MKQISFSQAEFQRKKRRTRREVFLAEMEQIMPWEELFAVVEPHYPKGKRGRPPVGLERMLRVYFVQQWNGLSDEGVEYLASVIKTCRRRGTSAWQYLGTVIAAARKGLQLPALPAIPAAA